MRKREHKTHKINLLSTNCPLCGKEFFPHAEHVYKDYRKRTRNVCSYSCVLKSQRLREEEKDAREEKKKAGGRG